MATIVFCEDDETIIKLISLAMRPTGHQVFLAPNGAEGLRLIEQVRPDLVISDVAMPEVGGFAMLDAIRAQSELAHIPVVFLTASVQRPQQEEGMRRGASGFLLKPFGIAELRQKVEHFLTSGRAAEKEAPNGR